VFLKKISKLEEILNPASILVSADSKKPLKIRLC
jgi:hypothetical protein